LVLEYDMDIHSETKWHETPLHHAVVMRHPETCEALLQMGANPLYEDKMKRTPYQL